MILKLKPDPKPFNIQTLNPKCGFTLLEIIIVMAIFAAFSIPVLGQYITTQKRARDAVRRQNINAISSALEQYYSVCNFQYPASGSFLSNSIACTAINLTIMAVVPRDPKTGNAYTCSGCNANAYTICATLEADVAPTPTGFCMSNRQ